MIFYGDLSGSRASPGTGQAKCNRTSKEIRQAIPCEQLPACGDDSRLVQCDADEPSAELCLSTNVFCLAAITLRFDCIGL